MYTYNLNSVDIELINFKIVMHGIDHNVFYGRWFKFTVGR